MKRGFTLIELMVVIAIIGLLSAIAMPRFSNITNSAKAAQVQGNLANIRTAVNMFHAKTGVYPKISNDNNDELHRVAEKGFEFTDFYSKGKLAPTPPCMNQYNSSLEESNFNTTTTRTDGKIDRFTGEGGWLFITEKKEDGSPYTGEVYANITDVKNYDPFNQGINWHLY